MSTLLLKAAVRYHARHPWQLLLAIVGVTLGVAVVVAVDVANASARRAFLLSAEAVSGRATHEIIGGPGGLPDSLYTALRADGRAGSVAPIVDRHVRVTPRAGEARVLRLLGVDPFAEAPFRPYVSPAAGQLDIGALLTGRLLVLAATTADQLGVVTGDTVEIRAGALTHDAAIGGVLEPADDLARRALADVALADIATAQELTGAFGVLDRIEVRYGGADDGLRDVARLLPPGARLLEAGARSGATVRLTRAFETNLLALALVALVFGMFLIYNSVTFSLVQRRPLIGLLRAQGVTAREVLFLMLTEAAVIGAIATGVGIICGAALGAWLVDLVARTINDLYFTVTVAAARADAVTVGKALGLGVGATVVAALVPVLEAVRTRPRQTLARSALERRARAAAIRLALPGAVLACASAAMLLLPSRSLLLGFAALFILILAAALLTPAATLVLMAALRPIAAAAGPVARIGARSVSATLSRTAPAIAALSVALAVGIAVTVMIDSFRQGVIVWLERSLQADIYISAPDLGADRTDSALDPAFIAQLAALPGVAGISTYRHASLLVGEEYVRLIAVDLHDAHRAAFELLDGRPETAWTAFAAGGILVSEPIAFRRGLRAGSTYALPTDRGTVDLTVAAVYRDYASEHGVVFIDRAVYQRLWDDDAVTSLGVFLQPAADADAMIARIGRLPAAAGSVARSNQGLRESTLVVFDRTFVITGVLRILALLVAFVGVAGALMALQLERVREIGVLRATGLTPAQVLALVTTQTTLMGVVAAILSAPLGLIMAWTMVHVINRRAFGWSFDMMLGTAPFGQALLVGVAAALLGGLYPAWRMARIRPALALRDE